MKRDHRLDIENFLRAATWPDTEISVALKGEAVEVANRILQLFRKVRGALTRRVVAGRRLLSLRRARLTNAVAVRIAATSPDFLQWIMRDASDAIAKKAWAKLSRPRVTDFLYSPTTG